MKKILVATDFNDLATGALRVAAKLAACAGGELIVLYADQFEPPAEFTASQVDALAGEIDESRRRTDAALREYVRANVGEGVAWRAVVVDGPPVDAILRAAKEHGVDMIAIGTHGRGGLERLMLGSIAESVLRRADAPVLTVRHAE